MELTQDIQMGVGMGGTTKVVKKNYREHLLPYYLNYPTCYLVYTTVSPPFFFFYDQINSVSPIPNK